MIFAEQTQTPVCPVCGGVRFKVAVYQDVVVEFYADDHEVVDGPMGDMGWDDDSYALCCGCNHFAKLGNMREP